MTEIEYAKLIARNLKRIAYENGKNQADIAKDLNISKATVSSWMTGTRIPRMDKIDMLCHYFNCKRSDIMEEHTNGPAYYTKEETAKMAQELFDDPNRRILMAATKDLKPENLQLLAQLALQMKNTNPDG